MVHFGPCQQISTSVSTIVDYGHELSCTPRHTGYKQASRYDGYEAPSLFLACQFEKQLLAWSPWAHTTFFNAPNEVESLQCRALPDLAGMPLKI
jgi:hypothetical protein